jgi:mRNA-degrading endonuclease RelE of RelBE toxin-antitoxin system
LSRWHRSTPRAKAYRVLYLVDNDRVIVDITSVTHRADAYRRR